MTSPRPAPLAPSTPTFTASEPWRGFAADPRGADLAFALFFLLTLPPLLLGRPSGWPLLVLLHVASFVLLASRKLRTRVLAPLEGAWPAAARHARSWYPVLAVPALYALLPLLNQALQPGYFDPLVQRWEAALFGAQPARTWAAHAPFLPLSELLHAAYLAYYPLIFVPPMLLHMRGERRGFEVVVSTFAIVSVIHFLFFVYFPVEGPRYRFPVPTAGSIDSGPLFRLTHAVLEAGSSRGAAFPSAHVGVAAAQAVLAWRWLPRWAPWITAVAVLLGISTVYGGFHYLVDALAGAAVGAGVAALARGQAPRPRG